MNETKVTKDKESRSLILERVFDNPREVVWGAWSNGDSVAQWWGPHGWETTNKQFDFKPGGVWHYGMKCVDENQKEWFGQVSWGKAIFGEINAPDSFTWTDEFADEQGNSMPGMPVSHVTMQFSDEDGKTKVTSTTKFDSDEAYEQVLSMGVEEGVKETWDRLAEFLEREK